MKVLHVAPSFYPAMTWGGPITALYALCNALASFDDVDLRVLTTDSAGPRRDQRVIPGGFPARYEGYDVYFCRRWFGNEVSPGLVAALGPMVRWADIVHLTATYSFPTIPALAACRIHQKPVVWSPRGALKQWAGRSKQKRKALWDAICRALVPSKFVFHCTSGKEAEESVATFRYGTAVVIPNGVDIPQRNKRYLHTDRARTLKLLYMGLISPIKGLDCLVDAMHLLPGEGYQLDVYGIAAPGYDRYYQEIRDRADNGPAASRIRFHGFADGERKAQAFLEADVSVVPSHSENFSNVVAEALAYGLPVVASRGVPWPNLERFDCGVWVENAPPSLAAAIRSLRDRDLSVMGSNGRRWMIEEFSWETVASRMHHQYAEMLNG